MFYSEERLIYASFNYNKFKPKIGFYRMSQSQHRRNIDAQNI